VLFSHGELKDVLLITEDNQGLYILVSADDSHLMTAIKDKQLWMGNGVVVAYFNIISRHLEDLQNSKNLLSKFVVLSA
jgi:hypothetical protein